MCRPRWAVKRHRQKRVVGRPWVSPGHWDTWREHYQERPVAKGPPPGPRRPGSDLGLQPRAYPVWEEKSLCNCPPAPPPAEEAPHPASRRWPCSAPPTPPPGRDPRCTHCKKCTFRGRGWGAEWRDSELLGRGHPVWSLHPPEPWDGRTPLPPLSPRRWEVGASGLSA